MDGWMDGDEWMDGWIDGWMADGKNRKVFI